MRQPFIAANWKMHKTREEAQRFVKSFLTKINNISTTEIGLGPTFTALDIVATETKNSPVKTCAQNMYPEPEGAFTGEISPVMLNELETDYVIVGHSERRNIFGESDELVNKKIRTTYDYGMKPILCIGESQQKRAAGETKKVLQQQLQEGLQGLTADQGAKLAIAYEPIWAIGTGESASPEDAQEGCNFVREEVRNILGKDAASQVRIQYGGSIKPHNAEDLMSQPDIDGGLIGSASLEPDSFASIIHTTEEIN